MSERNGWHETHTELAARIEVAIAKRNAKGLPNASDIGSDIRKLSALIEEVGEVATAVHECEFGEPRSRVLEELFDVAVLAILWASAETTPARISPPPCPGPHGSRT